MNGAKKRSAKRERERREREREEGEFKTHGSNPVLSCITELC